MREKQVPVDVVEMKGLDWLSQSLCAVGSKDNSSTHTLFFLYRKHHRFRLGTERQQVCRPPRRVSQDQCFLLLRQEQRQDRASEWVNGRRAPSEDVHCPNDDVWIKRALSPAEMFDKQQANSIFWSPQGQFLVLAGLRRSVTSALSLWMWHAHKQPLMTNLTVSDTSYESSAPDSNSALRSLCF